MKANYTNINLAREYHAFAHRFGTSSFTVCRSLHEVSVDVPLYYSQHGTLDTLDLPGAGKVAKRYLALILKHGYSKAVCLVEKEKTEKHNAASMRLALKGSLPYRIPFLREE